MARSTRLAVLTAGLCALSGAAGALDTGRSPLLDSLSDGRPIAAIAPIAGRATAFGPAPDADDLMNTLHCRAEVVEAFQMMRDYARTQDDYYEAAILINLNLDGSLRFVLSNPAGAELCQVVRPTAQTIAIAHTHPSQRDVVQEPTGADCDSPFPNYVVTQGAVYLTGVPAPGAATFSRTGRSGDLGSYRRVMGDDWRSANAGRDPAWVARCLQEARRPTSRAARCSFDESRARAVRTGRPITCSPAPAPRLS